MPLAVNLYRYSTPLLRHSLLTSHSRLSPDVKLTSLRHPCAFVPRRNFAVHLASCSSEKVEPVNGVVVTDGEEVVHNQGLVTGTTLNEGDEVTIFEEERKEDMSRRNLKDRIVFGLAIGVGGGGVVLAGGWLFAGLVAAASFMAAREYFGMVRSQGIAMGMTPPPRYVSRVCLGICALMPLLTLYFGHIDVSVTSSAFVLVMSLILQRGNPRFAQLSSAIFGLFYCGYLPCFWVKLRCGLAVPALNTKFSTLWPVLLGGQSHWTVGLIATLVSVSSIIAADTFAFLGGKLFGHTPLTNISPKKTLEGAVAGLIGCVCIALILSRIFCWPTSLLSCRLWAFATADSLLVNLRLPLPPDRPHVYSPPCCQGELQKRTHVEHGLSGEHREKSCLILKEICIFFIGHLLLPFVTWHLLCQSFAIPSVDSRRCHIRPLPTLFASTFSSNNTNSSI